jgi:hypothetical protein
MENIQYESYKPGKGYGKIQAEIYNANTGENASGKEIEQKIAREKKDPNLLRYAFTSDGVPLAYIQASQVSSSTYYLGYPWSVPECPPAVQEKLFSDMMDYLKTKSPSEIQYWIKADWKTQIDFFLGKGFQLITKGLELHFDIQSLSTAILKNATTYTSRIATEGDLELLLDVSKADIGFKSAGLKKDFLKGYFINKVLPDGHCVLIFKNEKIVCASAPLPELNIDPPTYVFLRFSATRPGYEDAWPLLVIEIAKKCLAAGWDLPLHVNTEEGSHIAESLSQFNPVISESYSLYALKIKK